MNSDLHLLEWEGEYKLVAWDHVDPATWAVAVDRWVNGNEYHAYNEYRVDAEVWRGHWVSCTSCAEAEGYNTLWHADLADDCTPGETRKVTVIDVVPCLDDDCVEHVAAGAGGGGVGVGWPGPNEQENP